MGLVLDEPKAGDRKARVEGFSFVMTDEVARLIRSQGALSIDYRESRVRKGFDLSLING